MREDDAPESDQAQGSLADGLGQTPGENPVLPSESSGDDVVDDGAYGDGADDGDLTDGADTTHTVDEDDAGGDLEASDLPDDPTAELDSTLADPLAQDASPLEGLGFLLEELRDAVFGDDDEGAVDDLPDDLPGVGPDHDGGVIDA